MPNPRKGPRLYLRKTPGLTPQWSIRDVGVFKRLPFGEHERDQADAALQAFIAERHPEGLDRSCFSVDDGHGFIYFVSTDEIPDFPIKIGWTKRHDHLRLKQLQNGCPYRLKILAIVHALDHMESALHAKFKHLRMTGEWMRRAPDLMEYIDQLAGIESLLSRHRPGTG